MTSEHAPDWGGNDDQYGFMDLTLSKDNLTVEAISHGGQVRRKIVVEHIWNRSTVITTSTATVTTTATNTTTTTVITVKSAATTATTTMATNTKTTTASTANEKQEAASTANEKQQAGSNDHGLMSWVKSFAR